MQSTNDENDPHIDWSRLGKKSREQINTEAAEEKAKVGLTGRGNQLTAHLRGNRYDISAPDVKAIRESLGLTQEAFAARFI